MTDKDKLLKIRKLADVMYYAAQYLTTDASKLHKAMDEYHKFVTLEYYNRKEEDVNNGLDLGCGVIWRDKEAVSDDMEQAIDTYLATYFGGEKEKQDWPFLKKMAIHFAEWQKKQLMKDAIEMVAYPKYGELWGNLIRTGCKDGDRVKVIVIKEN